MPPTSPDEEHPDDGAATRLADRETVRLPIQRPPARGSAPGRRSRRAPLALAASVTTTWAALVSLAPMIVVVLLVHLADGSGATGGQVARLGLALWLLGHGVPVVTDLGPIALAPLALTLMAAWRVGRAGVHTARAVGARSAGRSPDSSGRVAWSPWPALAAGGAVGIAYGLLGALGAAIAGHRGFEISVLRAGLTLTGFGVAAGVAGAFTEARGVPRLAGRVPPVIRDGLRTGVVAALLILGAGATVAGMAVAVEGGDASQIIDDYHTGVAGQAGLILICAIYAPNVAVWATSYLIGPGFTFGAETSISPAEVTLGPLPAVPVLAGLPSGPASGWAALLLGLPLAAALVAGWLLARRMLRGGRRDAADRPWGRLLPAGILAGPVAGVLLALVSGAASGSLGDGGLADIGPRVALVGLVGTCVVAVGGTLGAAATKIVLRARRPR